MFFKSTIRQNPVTQNYEGYYRLVESYRNELNRVCHTTLLNIGFITFPVETLNRIRLILQDKVNRTQSLFEVEDPEAIKWAEIYWQQLISSGKVDVSDQAHEKKMRMVDVETLRHKDVREIGSEWLCYQAVEQLKIKEKLTALGWNDEQVKLAITQIVSRAIYPYSESRTSRWIQENSAICEVTGYPIEKITKDKLYQSALDLFGVKDALEQHLSHRTNELFDLQDRIILYDLTNTYFEGQKGKSKIAAFARSKEKRNDAKLVVLALVVNVEGFVKYSNVFEGNKTDVNPLPEIIDNIRVQTSQDKRAVVVLDAGISSAENLALIQSKGYDYVCVSRAKIKDYQVEPLGKVETITSKNKEQISLEKVINEGTTDYLLKVRSEAKLLKEQSMRNQFESRFLLEMEKIKASLTKKKASKPPIKLTEE